MKEGRPEENDDDGHDDDDVDTLISQKALELSLSAPRVPQYGTTHRSILMGRKKMDLWKNRSLMGGGQGTDCQHRGGPPPPSLSSFMTTMTTPMRYDHNISSSRRRSPRDRRSVFTTSTFPRRHHHPHLREYPTFGDRMTRIVFGPKGISLSRQNHLRDDGGFRSIADGLLEYSIPLGMGTQPQAVYSFLQLTYGTRYQPPLRQIRYGPHKSQIIDLMFPPKIPSQQREEQLQQGNDSDSSKQKQQQHSNDNDEDWDGMVVFIHGGAWGSGKPWYYRLIAQSFLTLNMAVAIVGYRVYPDGNTSIQVEDIEMAISKLSKEYPNVCGPHRHDYDKKMKKSIGMCIMGHSSGAHIALLTIVKQAKELILQQQQRTLKQRQRRQSRRSSSTKIKIEQNDNNNNDGKNSSNDVDDSKTAHPGSKTSRLVPICDLFVGLSGPYDISHHFDYEAARGVEEFSPMKACNGYTREQFRENSPAYRLYDLLTTLKELDCGTGDVVDDDIDYDDDNDAMVGVEGIKSNSRDDGADRHNRHRLGHLDNEDSMRNHIRTKTVLRDYFPELLFVHGMEDETVPFTATAEVAYRFRSVLGGGGKMMKKKDGTTAGSTAGDVGGCYEYYIPKIGHQDTVVHLMLGGKVRTFLQNWLRTMKKKDRQTRIQRLTKMTLQSKL